MRKEVKRFFHSLDNDLNKGHEAHLKRRRNNYYSQGALDKILPPIEVISAYEELYPGTLEKALEIAQNEQQNRYNWLMKSSIAETRWKALGHFFSFLSMAVVGATVVRLASLGHLKLSAYIALAHLLASFLLALMGLYLNRPAFPGKVYRPRPDFQEAKKRESRGHK